MWASAFFLWPLFCVIQWDLTPYYDNRMTAQGMYDLYCRAIRDVPIAATAVVHAALKTSPAPPLPFANMPPVKLVGAAKKRALSAVAGGSHAQVCPFERERAPLQVVSRGVHASASNLLHPSGQAPPAHGLAPGPAPAPGSTRLQSSPLRRHPSTGEAAYKMAYKASVGSGSAQVGGGAGGGGGAGPAGVRMTPNPPAAGAQLASNPPRPAPGGGGSASVRPGPAPRPSAHGAQPPRCGVPAPPVPPSGPGGGSRAVGAAASTHSLPGQGVQPQPTPPPTGQHPPRPPPPPTGQRPPQPPPRPMGQHLPQQGVQPPRSHLPAGPVGGGGSSAGPRITTSGARQLFPGPLSATGAAVAPLGQRPQQLQGPPRPSLGQRPPHPTSAGVPVGPGRPAVVASVHPVQPRGAPFLSTVAALPRQGDGAATGYGSSPAPAMHWQPTLPGGRIFIPTVKCTPPAAPPAGAGAASVLRPEAPSPSVRSDAVAGASAASSRAVEANPGLGHGCGPLEQALQIIKDNPAIMRTVLEWGTASYARPPPSLPVGPEAPVDAVAVCPVPPAVPEAPRGPASGGTPAAEPCDAREAKRPRVDP